MEGAVRRIVNQDIELETTLVICSASPYAVADEIAGLEALAGYGLRAQDDVAIVDTHYDLPDGSLAAHGLSMRLRSMDDAFWLTLKGKGQAVGGAVRRMELERPWGSDGLREVVEALLQEGIDVPLPLDVSAEFNPDDIIEELGFEPVQSRQTERRGRDVLSRDGDVIGELVIDMVTYQPGGQRVRHYEIEIEQKAEGVEGQVEEMVDELKFTWPDELRAWWSSKLRIGMGLETLASQQQLGPLISESEDLLPQAYDELERVLGSAQS